MMQSLPAIDAVADVSRLRTVLYQSGTLVHGPYGMGMQPVDADLTAIAALSGTGIAVRTGSGTWTTRTITGTASRITVTNGDGVSGNPTINISTSYAGQATITTLGTVATGTWAAGAVTAAIAGATPIVAHRTNNTINATYEARPQSGNSMFFGLGAADTFAVRGGSADLNSSPWISVTSGLTSFAGSIALPNAGTSTGVSLGTGTGETRVGANGVLAREGGTLIFRPNGSGSSTSQATLTTAGTFTATGLVGDTVSVGSFSASGASSGKLITDIAIQSSRPTTGTATHLSFYNPNGVVGSITTNGSATAYNTSSDERLKDFIGLYDPAEAISVIRADPVREFTWKSSGERAVGWGAQTSYGISHDLASPPADDDGMWGIDQSRRTPYLWAALSAALDRIEALEARVAELESS